jgi:hypothetical protein
MATKLARDTKTDVLKVTWDEFLGLDLQPDVLSRPPNTWRRIENCDLFVPGSVRKIVGPEIFQTAMPSVIVEMLSYLRDSTSSLLLLGIGSNGHLYNLSTKADLATLGSISNPFVALMTGTAGGSDKVFYLICTTNGGPPVKWESVGGVSPIGVSPADESAVVTVTASATNAHAYLMQVGIQYLWTYFNPNTLHESSPSPVDKTAIVSPTSNQPPPDKPYITQVKIDIPTPAPAIGSGYTRIRIYRTRDGGATFYLLPKVYDAGGVNLSDGNNSVLIQGGTTTVYDGVDASALAPTQDQELVNPPGGAPEIGSHDPPPDAIWGAVYQGRLWLLDSSGRRLWFSQIGDFQSFGVNNFFDFSNDILDTVTSIESLSDRMIVFGKNTARQITGTDFSSFVEVPIDMRRGCLGRRASVHDGDQVYLLTAQSLARLAFANAGPPFLGDKIKPLTDSIKKSALLNIIDMEIDSTRGILMFGVQINGLTYNDQIILVDLSRSPESPFTTINGLSTEVVTLRELEFSDGSKDVLFSGADRQIYRVYSKNSPLVGSLVATLETQELPLEDIDVWKVFQSVSMIGQDMSGWKVSYSVDDEPFTPLIPLNFRTPCGQSGLTMVVRFVHDSNPTTVPALLSRGILRYTSKFAAR